jgi:hypothetical protein
MNARLIALCCALATGPAQARAEAMTAEDALRIGNDFARKVGKEPVFIKAERRADSQRTKWSLESADANVWAGVDAETGTMTSYWDLNTRHAMGQLWRRREPWALATDEEAWRLAEAALAAAGLDVSAYGSRKIEWIARRPLVSDPPQYLDTSVNLHFGQTVEGLEGELNSASVTVDVVSGKLSRVHGSTFTRFEPTARTMDREDALFWIKAYMAHWSVRGRLRASKLAWPSDDFARAGLKLVVSNGSAHSAFGCDDGVRLIQRGAARAGWSLRTPTAHVVLDAGNGRPLEEGLFSHEGGRLLPRPDPERARRDSWVWGSGAALVGIAAGFAARWLAR